MGITGKVIGVNLTANQSANVHLTQVAEILKQRGRPHDILFYTTNEKELKRVLQQRRIEMLYLIAHAELEAGIIYKGDVLNPKAIVSLLGGLIPKHVYLNCCFGHELGYQAHLLHLGCQEVVTNQGFIEHQEAFARGLEFIKQRTLN